MAIVKKNLKGDFLFQVDSEMAKVEADKVEDNEELRKKLWLMIARHVIQQGKAAKGENIRKAVAFLKETDGLLKIEDILPFFPDFSLIDDFKVIKLVLSSMSQTNVSVYSCRSKLSLSKLQILIYLQLNLLIMQEAICSSLEDYNRQIEELKRDMNDATLGAENIRNDITALSQRYAVVKRDETCRVSKKTLIIMTILGTCDILIIQLYLVIL